MSLPWGWRSANQIFMINLNLLPPKEKENIRLDLLDQRIIIIGGYLIAALLIFIVLLVVNLMIINFKISKSQNNFQDLQKKFAIEGFKDIQNKLKNINNKIKNIDQIQKNYPYYSTILEKIIAVIPNGAQISNISVTGKHINLAGFAANRDSVVNIKDSLEKSSDFGNINYPLSNFLQAENINFSFSFDIK